VPKQHAPYLFTPFFTTKAPGEGTGLGLSLSYGMVKAHGGTLSYEPVPEGGAEFRIVLPLFQAEVDPGAEPAQANGRAIARRILVVDEDPAVHRLVSALFTPDGHAVEAVRSAEQALRLARERDWDLIIADIQMAAGAAEPFARALLHACPGIGGRLVMACSGEDDLRSRNGEEAFRRVKKPFNPRDLRTVAQEVFQ
jgi:CheY-like chemotaxis protein